VRRVCEQVEVEQMDADGRLEFTVGCGEARTASQVTRGVMQFVPDTGGEFINPLKHIVS
jgi:hypothetical protein